MALNTGLGDSKKVLFVDDDKDIVEVFSLLLKGNGFDVITAYDGLECVNAVFKTQ